MPGRQAIAPDRLLTVSLDELLLVPTRPALRPLCQFLDVYLQQRMRAYFQREMSAERANTERWRHGLSRAPRRRDRARLRGGRGGARGRSRALRAARAPHARALPRPTAPRSWRRSRSCSETGLRWAPGRGRRQTRLRVRRERPRLRRRHGAQRHARDRQAARPALALRDGPDRVPLPLQSEWARGRRHRQGDAGGVPGQAAQVLVAPGPSRRARPGARGVAGAAEAARCAASTRSLPATASKKRSRGFEASCDGDPVAASRTLFFDLLGPLGSGRGQARAGRDELLHDRRRLPAWRGSSRRRGSCTPFATGATRPPRRPPSARRHTTRPGSPTGSTGGWGGCGWPRRACAGWTIRGARGPDQPGRARLGRPRARLRRPARLPRAFRRARDARVLQLADERRRGPPRALARGASPSRTRR